MTFRYWRRKLLIIFLLFVLIIVLYLNQKRFNNNINNNNINNNEIIGEESRSLSSNKLSQIISKLSTIESNLIDIEGGYDQKVIELTELNKCDNCLGNNFCQLFITNSLVINTPYIRNGLKFYFLFLFFLLFKNIIFILIKRFFSKSLSTSFINNYYIN
jgi:hypothetical protein